MIKSALDNLSLEKFIYYLQSCGWTQVPYNNDRMIVFARTETEGEPSDLVTLPASEKYTDSAVRIAEAVKRLADIEETTPQDIIGRIHSAEQDIISLRLLLPPNEHPSVEVISYLFQGLRNLIIYGACMEKTSKRRFDQPLKLGKEQARHFQFAHTFQGSFGFTIESQVIEAQSFPWHSDHSRPLQRRVLERITRGFLFAQNAQQKQDPDEISQNFEQGFNANMCDAAAEMLQALQDTQMLYSVSWSYRLPASQDVAQIFPISLEKGISHYLKEAALYLKIADKDLEEEKVLKGHITNLSFEEPTEEGIITLFTEEWGRVNFAAKPDEYLAACNARETKQMISITGRLVKQGKRKPWKLLNPHNFHLQ